MFADPSLGEPPKRLYQQLWKFISEHPKIHKAFNEKAMMVLRCYAVVMIRNEGLINQFNKDYMKCVKKLSDVFDLEYEKVDFMIDIISGYPLDIFKASPKNPDYNIQDDDNTVIKARFDNLRMNLLANLL
jgi:hypothetical protein